MADDTREFKVGGGFSLVMQLKDPLRLPELMGRLAETNTKDRIDLALRSLDYIHYARFLPLWEQGLLLIVTEFDGAMQDYVTDFAAVLDQEFSMILSYMKDGPRLPVSRYPDEFCGYVLRNTRPGPPFPKYDDPFSPYADKTVLEILGPGQRKSLPARPEATAATVKLADVQANVLRGFRARHAIHLGLRFSTADSGRDFIGALTANGEVSVTPAQPSPRNAEYCLNIGFTHTGLQALGLPPAVLGRFPQAYREGPAMRAKDLGDEGDSAPQTWDIGRLDSSGRPVEVVHAMVSLFVKADRAIEHPLERVRALFTRYGIVEVFKQPGDALDDLGTMHFGYRDGISQPRMAAVHDAIGAAGQPISPPGDFLLGTDYVNSRGGNYIGELIPDLVQNATYAALRVIEQHVGVFESLLEDAAVRHSLAPELVAAKLMGRWRDGSPLVLWPNAPAPAPGPGVPRRTSAVLNDFDYVASVDDVASGVDDSRGLRCPVGAHIRRMNPRGGMVMGIPWGRRVIRRGMPFGPKFDKDKADDEKRGLVGLFLGADLESQFEFLQRVWANKDLSAFGLRGTKELFVGGRGDCTPFRFVHPDNSREITIDVPPLTRTIGSLYLLMPGMLGLHWIASAGWISRHSRVPMTPTPAKVGRPAVDISYFDPADASFRVDPYRFYAAFRAQAPVSKPGGAGDSYWVYSHALVTDVCEHPDVFLKPGKDRDQAPRPFSIASRFGDGLFFMDPPRHSEVRAMMNQAFGDAIAGARDHALNVADELLAPVVARGTMELVGEFASKLPTRVFMNIMGIPSTDAALIDGWSRAALESHDKQAAPGLRLAGATATMALRAYFLALAMERPAARTSSGSTSLMGGMQFYAGCPASPDAMGRHEVMNTALHFALGGYLSTEFLIATGVHNLLRHPDQWNKLRADRSLLSRAVHEMLRYDAPFQMADRWVGEPYTLGGVALERGDKVTIVYGSANRDGKVFVDPDRFDIEREITQENFGFGHWVHHCIGEPLALEVAKVAISALLDRFPSASIGEVGAWSSDPYFRTLKQLTLLLR